MFVVGLTGGMGSGKSTVADIFAELGAEIIDTDQIAREVVQKNSKALKKITRHFKTDILNEDGTLNRKKLRQIIFSNPEEKLWLEKLLHPLIRSKTLEYIKRSEAPYCVVVIPLLVETKPNPFINRVLVVDCFPEQQLERLRQREKISDAEAKAIFKTQATREERLAASDDVINNQEGLDSLKEQVLKLHQFYLQLSHELGKL